ncbi:hypothetical protein Tco_1184149 [Tanacetum coccineum]
MATIVRGPTCYKHHEGSRANDSRVSTDAPFSTSSPSINSFDMQQIAASLEDKMTIKMKQIMNEMKALVVTTPATVPKQNVNPFFEENDKDAEIKSSSSFTLTSPEESEFEAYLEIDSIPPGIDLTHPPTLEISSSNPTSPTLTGEKDFKKNLTALFDSSESSILPSPLLDSDSPFTAELSVSVTLNSLGNEDKVFKPGTDKSKITRKQSKASKHGHENQKSTKRSQRFKAEAPKDQSLSQFSSPRTNLAISKILTVEEGAGTFTVHPSFPKLPRYQIKGQIQIKGCVGQFKEAQAQMQGQISLIKGILILAQAQCHVSHGESTNLCGFCAKLTHKTNTNVTSKNASLAILSHNIDQMIEEMIGQD